MGCAQSKEASAPSAPNTKSTSAAHTKAKRKPAKPRTDYETEVSASLVESGGSNVPFHGILSDAGRLKLTRNVTATNSQKLFDRSCHPDDDARLSSADPRLTIVTGVIMTMPYTIIVTTEDATDAINAAIQPVFEKANRVYNGWNPDSEISLLNSMPPEKKIPLSPNLSKILQVVDLAYEMTDGRYDPTTGVLSAAFENCISDEKRPPLPSEMAPLKHAVGWKRRLLRTDDTIARLNSHTLVDLDGMSKGFVIDRIIDALLTVGFSDCYVDWAGDVRAVGSHPDDRPWRSAVVRPPALARVFSHWQASTLKDMLEANDIAYFANLVTTETNGCAMATSGDYFSVQKYGFHHIALGKDLTVMKASQRSVGSVCVIAKTCALADAVATAAMTFNDVNEAVKFMETLEATRPDHIFGHCIMARHPSRTKRIERFSDDFFVAAENRNDSASVSGAITMTVSEEESKKMTARVNALTYQSSGFLNFNDAITKIDSFVSCSMDPDPLVTFMVPWSFIKDGSESAEDELNCLRYIALKSEQKGGKGPGTIVDLRISKIERLDHVAFVGATIEDVDLHSVIDCRMSHNRAVFDYTINLNVARSQFPLCPILEKAQSLHRHIPSTVWAVTTTSSESTRLALTATSVNVPKEGCGLVTFNVSHTSAFYAGLGGSGTLLQIYALSNGLADLARKFVTECRPDSKECMKLEAESLASLTCTIESTLNLQDHLVVFARLCDLRTRKGQVYQRPLIWVAGDYVSW